MGNFYPGRGRCIGGLWAGKCNCRGGVPFFYTVFPEEPDEKLLEIVENWDIGFCFQRQDGIFGVVRESDWCLIEEAYQKLRATEGRRRYMLQANGTFSNENEFARSIQQCVLDRYTLFYEEKAECITAGKGRGWQGNMRRWIEGLLWMKC